MTRLFAFAFAILLITYLPMAAAAPQAAADEALFRLSDSAAVNTQTLLSDMQSADAVLLGEIHDNPRHHELRAQLLREPALKQRNIVAEHLDAGQVVGTGDMLLSRLEQAGFDATGWQWPLHQPLFAAALDQGMTVYGGNLPRDQTRVVFKSRGSSLGVGLQALLLHAPLSDDSLAALRREIDDMGEFALLEQRIHRRGISQIALDKAEVFLAPEHGEARVLQRRIVIGIEIVKAGDVGASGKQAAGDVKTDEASGSGDENL